MWKRIAMAVIAVWVGAEAFAALPERVVTPEVAVPPPPVVTPLRVAPFTHTNRNRCLPAEPATEARPQGDARECL